MDWEASLQRLSRIDTLWSLVCQAHDPSEAQKQAQAQLLERYGGAIRRYLLAGVRQPDVADELFQEFACQLLKGGLRGADPTRGKFRYFVRGVLFHLIADYHRRKGKQPKQLGSDFPEPADASSPTEADQEFLTNWRDELLARAWSALTAHEKATGQPFFTVLRFRAEHPAYRSEELAHHLSQKLGKPLTAPGVRQTLHRARERFAELLLEEVSHSLQAPTRAELEDELSELQLLEYCRPVLERKEE